MTTRAAYALLVAVAAVAIPAAGQADMAEEVPVQDVEEQPPESEPTHKAGYRGKPAFGGPNSPQALLEEDDRIKSPVFRLRAFDEGLRPWFDWKRSVDHRLGLQLSGHCVSLYQELSDSLTDDDEAWSGLLRVTAKLDLVRRGTENHGGLVLTVDQRHAVTDMALPISGFRRATPASPAP